MKIEFAAWTLDDNDLMARWVSEDPGILASMRLPADTTEFRVRELLVIGLSAPDIQWYVASRNGEPVGAVGATHIQQDGSAVCHIVVPKEHQNSPLAVRIAKAAVDLAFGTLGLQTLVGQVPSENTRALRLDEHLGFRNLKVSTLQLTRDEYLAGRNGTGNSG